MIFIRWTLGFLTALFITVFAVMNRHGVDMHWSPINQPAHVPVYLIALGFLFAGFVFGAVMTWLGSAESRKLSRTRRKHIKKLEKELEGLSGSQTGGVPSNDLFPVIPAKIKR